MPIPPTNFSYNSLSKRLCWDQVPEADCYEIQFRTSIGTIWDTAYIGENTECPFVHDQGTYVTRGKSQSGPDWGIYGPAEEVIIP
jgi:hypothetical protein